MNSCKTEIHSQTQETNFWLSKGIGDGRDKIGAWNQHIHTSICKIDNQQGPTVSTGKYTQYLMITYNEKDTEKQYIYIYVCVCVCV